MSTETRPQKWLVSTTHATKLSTAWPGRYELLDGVRGLAAIAVVLHHVGVSAAGHFAVMVFFVISGYCITAAAEAHRHRADPIRSFMWRRARRIYPPYLLALLLYALTRGLKTWMGGHDDLSSSPLEWLQNLTLTQWLTLLAHPTAWATQNPTLFVPAFWSLDYEEQFYLVVALCLLLSQYQRVPIIVPILGLMAPGLCVNFRVPGDWVCGFFLEYWAHFALGSLLYFVLCVYTDWRVRVGFVTALAGLGTFLALKLLPWTPDRADLQRTYVEILFLIAVTLMLLALRPISAAVSRSPLWQPIAALGTISYSMYLIHQFNLTLVKSIVGVVLPAQSPAVVSDIMQVGLHVVLGSVFWLLCERPFQSGRRASSLVATVAA